jgi:hypothetical protein
LLEWLKNPLTAPPPSSAIRGIAAAKVPNDTALAYLRHSQRTTLAKLAIGVVVRRSQKLEDSVTIAGDEVAYTLHAPGVVARQFVNAMIWSARIAGLVSRGQESAQGRLGEDPVFVQVLTWLSDMDASSPDHRYTLLEYLGSATREWREDRWTAATGPVLGVLVSGHLRSEFEPLGMVLSRLEVLRLFDESVSVQGTHWTRSFIRQGIARIARLSQPPGLS